jgi:hypothetical protein
VSRRTLLLGLLLALVAGFGAWNLIRAQRAPAASGDGAAAATAAGAPRPAPADASSLTLKEWPGALADTAGTLSHFSDTLEWQIKSFMEDLGIEVHVVTLSAPREPSEALAADLFGLRKVGEQAPTGGLLVLLNPARREARIEVSYGLEPVLPDALVGRIADDQLAPYAAYRFAGMAVMDVLHFLKDYLTQQAIEGHLALDAQYTGRAAYAERARFLSGGAGASVRIPSAEELARDFKTRVADDRRARYAPGKSPTDSVEALLRVQQDLAGDPSLELFTEGSQCMRRGYPVAPYEELERARKLIASKPWRIETAGDRAVVGSYRPAPGFVPVLLHRVDGLWRVDLVETWKNLFFGEGGEYFLKNANTPYLFGLVEYGDAGMQDVSAWDLGGASLEQVVAGLESRAKELGKDGALYQYLLGEVLFCNCFLALDALGHYEEAARLGRGAPVTHDTLGRRAEYLGFYSLALDAYTRLGDAAASDVARMLAAQGKPKEAAAKARVAVARNPYDRDALNALRGYLTEAGDSAGAGQVEAQLAALANDPSQKHLPVGIRIEPPSPEYDIDTPTLVGKTKVFDHSDFSVTLENPTARAIEILKVDVRTQGTGDSSGLGEVKDYWEFPAGGHRIPAGESVTFDKTWGFISDTKNDQLSYVFDVCWRVQGDELSQCRSRRLDLFPR